MVLWDSWIAIGLLSVAAWGLSCVIDVCFVAEGIYRKPVDGLVVAGVFLVIPLFVSTGNSSFDVGSPGVAIAALTAGVFYLLHIYFYFRALFALNDASNAEIFNTLSVLMVPVLAYVLLGEVLEPLHYAAIGVSVLGVLLLIRLQLSTLTWKVSALLGMSVLFISLVMVMQAWVLEHVEYDTAVSLFSSGGVLVIVTLLVTRGGLRSRTMALGRRFGVVLVGVQLLELGAILGLQRATDVGPSVSLVALLECSLPLFVMGFSWLLLGLSRCWHDSTSAGIRTALAEQTHAYPAKLISLVFIVSAIILAQA